MSVQVELFCFSVPRFTRNFAAMKLHFNSYFEGNEFLMFDSQNIFIYSNAVFLRFCKLMPSFKKKTNFTIDLF